MEHNASFEMNKLKSTFSTEFEEKKITLKRNGKNIGLCVT